ncbi:MAG: hypothetical protein ACKO1X_01070 [Acidimicrobiales bacterium]
MRRIPRSLPAELLGVPFVLAPASDAAPATVGTCRVKVSVARSGSYRAFSTSISLAVTK